MGAETEVIYGQVVAKANHYMAVPDGKGGRRIIKDDVIRAYEKSFLEQCRIYKDRAIDTPFTLTIKVYTSSCKFDLDNSLKTVLDVLQYAHAITDDNLCVEINATKVVDRVRPRVEYSISTKEQTLF